MTPRIAATPVRVVAPEISISHLTLATMLAAAGSRGLSSSSANGLLMKQGRREEFVAADADAGDRLDRLLAARIADLSRTRVKSLILAGEVSIGGRTIRDPGHRVNAGDAITIVVPAPEPATPTGEAIPLDIVFEDG